MRGVCVMNRVRFHVRFQDDLKQDSSQSQQWIPKRKAAPPDGRDGLDRSFVHGFTPSRRDERSSAKQLAVASLGP